MAPRPIVDAAAATAVHRGSTGVVRSGDRAAVLRAAQRDRRRAGHRPHLSQAESALVVAPARRAGRRAGASRGDLRSAVAGGRSGDRIAQPAGRGVVAAAAPGTRRLERGRRARGPRCQLVPSGAPRRVDERRGHVPDVAHSCSGNGGKRTHGRGGRFRCRCIDASGRAPPGGRSCRMGRADPRSVPCRCCGNRLAPRGARRPRGRPGYRSGHLHGDGRRRSLSRSGVAAPHQCAAAAWRRCGRGAGSQTV